VKYIIFIFIILRNILTHSQYDISFRDLSFNKLSGTIPSTYATMNDSDYMYDISFSHIYVGFFTPTTLVSTFSLK